MPGPGRATTVTFTSSIRQTTCRPYHWYLSQSRDGNTDAENPGDLGGGPTDKHLIYEGLSRVAADAVLAGAATAVGPNVFFSVWHPQLVALRHELGLPRHPAQVVISNDGHLDLKNALLFNQSEVPVFVIVGSQCHDRCEASFRERPWISVVRLEANRTIEAFGELRCEHGLARISVVGGRSTASRLVDAGLVQDLCLTTTSRQGGEPNTPFYMGSQPPSLEVIVRKRSIEENSPILLEHLLVNPVSLPPQTAD